MRLSADVAHAVLLMWLAAAVGCSNPAAPDLQLPSASPQLVSGAGFSCLLDARGEVVCWGRWGGVAGQPAAATLPTRVTPGDGSLRFVTLSGFSHICALTSAGEAYCWGQNRYGQLGDGSMLPGAKPTPVATELRFAKIAAGAYHSCAVTRDGVAYCWGQNAFAALGTGTMIEGARELRPVAVAGSVRFNAIAVGSVSCGLTAAGHAYCWGVSPGSFEPYSEPGDCVSAYFLSYVGRGCLVPTPVLGDVAYNSLSSGGLSVCGVATTGVAYCWGEGWLGTLGNGRSGPGAHAVTPVAVGSGQPFQSVSSGASHVCGLTADGRALCWGNNFRGYLGNGEGSPGIASPVAVVGGHRFTNLAAGTSHTCALTEAAEIWCWGAGTEGQLGRSEQLGDSNVPVRVSLPPS